MKSKTKTILVNGKQFKAVPSPDNLCIINMDKPNEQSCIFFMDCIDQPCKHQELCNGYILLDPIGKKDTGK